VCYKEDIVEAQYDIKSFVSKYIFNKSDVPDVMQEINKVLLEKEDSFDVNKAFKAWVIGIAKWQIRAYLQKKKRNRELLFVDSPNHSIADNFISESFSNSIKSKINNSPSCATKKRDLTEEFDQDSSKYILKQTISPSILFHHFYNSDSSQARSLLYSCLEKHLNKRDRFIFNELVKGVSIEDIAESLSIKTVTARTAKFRMLKKLQKVIYFLKLESPHDYFLDSYL
jgi:RNA polymerase sigma factor (sigma-70 family)